MQNIDIPAAVRDYVEAERHGAGVIALNVAQAGIVTALMAADPSLSETAAAFRFHKLVDEMRGNDEISPETLARIVAAKVAANDGLPLNVVTKSTAETLAVLQAVSDATPEPQYVTVAQRHRFGRVWHLVAADNNPVAVGEHVTDTGLRFTITDEPDASCHLDSGEIVRIEVVWADGHRSWAKVEELVSGWHWQAERV